MLTKIFVFGGLLCGIATTQAQNFPPTLIKQAGYVLSVRAYIDPARLPSSPGNPASRYDIQISQPADALYHWDFTLPGSTEASTAIGGAYSTSDYKNQKEATIRATLRQFDTLDELVTFKDLDLTPPHPLKSGTSTGMASLSGPRFLSIKEARTIKTPSGITVTISAQNGLESAHGFDEFNGINGNINGLFIRIRVSPNAKLVSSLPASPLFQKHGRAVSIKLEAPEPYMMISGTADNTRTCIEVGIPKLKTVTHLDELNLIVRQRVDLRSVPVQFKVPISKPEK